MHSCRVVNYFGGLLVHDVIFREYAFGVDCSGVCVYAAVQAVILITGLDCATTWLFTSERPLDRMENNVSVQNDFRHMIFFRIIANYMFSIITFYEIKLFLSFLRTLNFKNLTYISVSNWPKKYR